MSRADYLSKYLPGGDDKKLKKKSKRPKSTKVEVPLIIENDTSNQLSQLVPEADEDAEALLNNEDPENEFLPVGIEVSGAPKQNKGFKRIDNGKIVAPAAPENPETVYRDTSGRIIDLNERRAQLKEDKERKEKEAKELQEQINSGELSRLKEQKYNELVAKAKRFDVSKNDAEYINHMTSKERFDDPLSAFGETKKAEAVSETGRPVYNKGINLPNRFKIKAGFFWDGIDRSNGFEESLLRKRNEIYVKKFTQKASAESYTEYDFD